MIQENELKNNIVENKILELFANPEKLESLALNANNFIIKDATNKIINEIKELDSLQC